MVVLEELSWKDRRLWLESTVFEIEIMEELKYDHESEMATVEWWSGSF